MNHQDDSNKQAAGSEQPMWSDDERLYRDREVRQLPNWWANAIEEFREYDLRPYKPPRFDDDVIVPPVVQRLESKHGVNIRFMGVNVQYGDSWGIYIEGTLVSTVSRERTSDAYSRYGITSGQFERLVHDYITNTKRPLYTYPADFRT